MHFPASWQTLAKETPADIPLLSCSSIVKFCCLRNKSALYDLGAGLYAVQSVENHACRCGPEGRDRPPDLITQAVLNAIESTGLRGAGGVRVGPAGGPLGKSFCKLKSFEDRSSTTGPLPPQDVPADLPTQDVPANPAEIVSGSRQHGPLARSGRACKSCRDCSAVEQRCRFLLDRRQVSSSSSSSSSSSAPLDARYFVRNPAVAEGNGLFHLVQEQFTPRFIRSMLFRPPLTGGAILGNGSVIEIEADCWSKAQSDSRYPLMATFNSLGSTVTSIDGRVSTLETDVGAIDGRVTALENSGGVAPTADLTVNSLTATTFVETPQLQSSAGDLQIQNALVTVRKEDGALLASFADGGISLDRDVTVAAASTLNATTADITQLTVGSTAATGAFSSNSSVTANLEVVSNLRLEAPLVRCEPTAPWLSIEGGAQGVLVNDTLRVNGAIAPEASLPYLFLSGGTTGLEMNTKFAAVTGLGDPGGFCELAVINQAPTGVARLFLSTQNNAPAGGRGELVALANGGVQLNALNQFISLNTTGGIANLAVEPNTGGSSNGEVIFGYGHLNASDRRLKTNIRRVPEQHVQRLFDEVEPQYYDRIGGAKDQLGFIAQDVQAAGKLGETLCKTMSGEEQLLALDYQKLSVVLWGVVKSLQKRVEKLEKKKRGRSD